MGQLGRYSSLFLAPLAFCFIRQHWRLLNAVPYTCVDSCGFFNILVSPTRYGDFGTDLFSSYHGRGGRVVSEDASTFYELALREQCLLLPHAWAQYLLGLRRRQTLPILAFRLPLIHRAGGTLLYPPWALQPYPLRSFQNGGGICRS